MLAGGAVGNLIDRIRLGYVVDFADIGIGTWRWYIFNIADMAVTCFFLLMIAIWIFAPGLLSGGGGKDAATDAVTDESAAIGGKGPVAE